MVVISVAGDHPYAAERCAALGITEVVTPGERTPARIRAAVRRVLDESRYRASSADLLVTELRWACGPQGARRRRRWAQRAASDPLLLAPIRSYVVGPETAPPEAFTWENGEAILAG